MQVPKGIYHYSERSQEFDTDAIILKLEHPFQAFGSHVIPANAIRYGSDQLTISHETKKR